MGYVLQIACNRFRIAASHKSTVRMRTGLAGEVTVTRERDAYSLARGIGDYYSLSFDLHQCMPLYLSRFQNHNRMYYIREDQICKAAKGVACWAPHCNKQRELQHNSSLHMHGRQGSQRNHFCSDFYICVFFYAKNVSFLWNPIYIY